MGEEGIPGVMKRANEAIALAILPEAKKALGAAAGSGEIRLSHTEAILVVSQLEAMAANAMEAASPISLGVSRGSGADSLEGLSVAVSELAVAVGEIIQSEADYVRHLVESMEDMDRQIANGIAG